MLRVNNLTGFGGLAFEKPSIALVHTTSNTSVNSDTWTVSGAAFGGLGRGQTRHLIAVATFHDTEVDETFSASMTIGGVSATAANSGYDFDYGAENSSAGILVGIAAVPTGVTGDVVVTVSGFSGAINAYGLALYRAVGLDSATPTTTPSGTSNITLVVPSNGFGVVGAVALTHNNVGSFTGSGATTAYSGSRAGAAMLRTASGSVVHDSSNAELFRGATWEFIT